MFPVLVQLGPYTVHAFGAFLAAGLALGALWAHHETRVRDLDAGLLPALLFDAALGMVVGGRLGYALFHAPYLWNHPDELALLWRGGLDVASGLALGAALMTARLRRHGEPLRPWADALAPGVALGQSVGAMGCLVAGCGMGRVTDAPWGVRLTHPEAAGPLLVPLHPLPLYHSLAAVTLFAVLVSLRGRLAPGQGTGILLATLGTVHLALAPLAATSQPVFGPLDSAQALAVVACITGFWILILRRPHVDRRDSRR